MFNIAQSYRLGGKPEKALVMYRAFLREAQPDAPNRRIAEKHADEIKHQLEDLKTAPTVASATAPMAPSAAPSAPPPVQPPLALRALAIPVAAEQSATDLTVARVPVSQEKPEHPFYTTWWFWTGTAAVVVGVVATLIVAGQKSKGACDGLGFSCVAVR